MLPQVHFEGRVVKDPELRFAQSGTAVAKVRLVASSRKRQDDGSWVDDKQCWINCTCFKQMAENVAESLTKGDLVVVTGRLQTEEWEKDGEKHSQIVVIADSIGPALTFTATKTFKATTERSSEPAADDPWAAPSTEEPPF